MQSKSSLGLISGHLGKSWFFLDQRLVIEPTFSPANLRMQRVTRKDFNLSLPVKVTDFFGRILKKSLQGLLLGTAEKLANRLTGAFLVTIPETLAGRISAPVVLSFLKWPIR